MNQDEITQIYETLAPMAGDYANAQAEQIGQAQRSMGPMASNVMGQSQTSGLGNYTYNRLMRPQVDVMRDEIRTQGYANQLNRLLSDSLNNARNRYNRSGGGGGGAPNTTNPENQPNDGVTTIGGSGEKEDTSPPAPDAAKVSGVSTVPSTAKEGEYNVGTATVNGETRIVTKNNRDNKYHISGLGSYAPGSKMWEVVKKEYNVQLNNYPGSSLWTIY